MEIRLENLTKTFPPRNAKRQGAFTAVDHLSLTIPDGALIGLLGPSGCGKSTTLNLLCGLESPTEGNIFFGQEDVTALAPELRGVGMVFQNYALYPHLTVEQNIRFPLENRKGRERLSREEMNRRVLETAGLVQIEELLDRRPRELSGGQQQRVAIARALVKSPKVLLLDEPLSNLDARLRLKTREEIRRIQKETGITTVFVTHDQEEAMSICDRIALMEHGVLMQEGRPQEVYDSPSSLFAAKFLGTPPINVFEGVIQEQSLRIGGTAVFPAPGASGQKVFAAIRPEGLILAPDGPLVCAMDRLEVMGRDLSIIASHPSCQSPVRALVDGSFRRESLLNLSPGEPVRFSLKEGKVFLFDQETGKVIERSRS